MMVSSSSFWLTRVQMVDARGKSPPSMEPEVAGDGKAPEQAADTSAQ